ncbi:MAG TPA: thiamine diphosphokinase [Candidatus Cloacimonas sp.]|nr:thiamine diphosphokinase [Candidatus Cloacimonas sp.]
MKRILIVANGPKLESKIMRRALDECQLVVAADGGIAACQQAGIEPDYLVGDMDSVASDMLLSKNTKKIYNPDQESTDMQKVLNFTRGLAADEIIVVNAFGGRADHTFANYLILEEFSREFSLQVYDDIGRLSFLRPGRTVLANQVGKIVSLWAFSGVEDLNLNGFKYNLIEKNTATHFLGISNEIVKDKATIEFKKGKLALYLHWEG